MLFYIKSTSFKAYCYKLFLLLLNKNIYFYLNKNLFLSQFDILISVKE